MEDIFAELASDEIVTIDDSKDYLSELVGEGKKFKDPQSLAKGKAESDAYIALLLKQKDELVKELNTRTSLDGFLDKMKSQREAPAVVDTPVTEVAQLDDATLEQKLADLLSKREAQKTSETNAERVKRVLLDQFGDKAQVLINNKARELGMSTQDLKSLATRSPSAFFTLVGVQENQERQAAGSPVARPSVNSFATPVSQVKNRAFYEKMKRDDPKKYFAPATTSEMMRSMAECRDKGIPWE